MEDTKPESEELVRAHALIEEARRIRWSKPSLFVVKPAVQEN